MGSNPPNGPAIVLPPTTTQRHGQEFDASRTPEPQAPSSSPPTPASPPPMSCAHHLRLEHGQSPVIGPRPNHQHPQLLSIHGVVSPSASSHMGGSFNPSSLGVSLTTVSDVQRPTALTTLPEGIAESLEAVPEDSTLRWAMVTQENCYLLWPMILGFREMCEREFDYHELEDLETWQENLMDGGETMPYIQTFSILLRARPGEAPYVVGGAARELYPESNCGLVSYIVVGHELRGRGFAQTFMKRAVQEMTMLLQRADASAKLSALFIEVLQKRDAVEGHGFDAGARQKIWERMGFLPLEFDLVHPGRLRGHRYQLAAYRDTVAPWCHPAAPGDPRLQGLQGDFPVEILRGFLHGLFQGIHLAAVEDDVLASEAAAAATPEPDPSGDGEEGAAHAAASLAPHHDASVHAEIKQLLDPQLHDEGSTMPARSRIVMGSGRWR